MKRCDAEPYPLFRGAHVALLQKRCEIELPKAWRQDFRAGGPGVIAPCCGEPAWNLYRNAESFAFRALDAGYPRCVLEVSGRGRFRLPPALQRPRYQPGMRLLFVGQGTWVQLWLASTFLVLMNAKDLSPDIDILKFLAL